MRISDWCADVCSYDLDVRADDCEFLLRGTERADVAAHCRGNRDVRRVVRGALDLEAGRDAVLRGRQVSLDVVQGLKCRDGADVGVDRSHGLYSVLGRCLLGLSATVFQFVLGKLFADM